MVCRKEGESGPHFHKNILDKENILLFRPSDNRTRLFWIFLTWPVSILHCCTRGIRLTWVRLSIIIILTGAGDWLCHGLQIIDNITSHYCIIRPANSYLNISYLDLECWGPRYHINNFTVIIDCSHKMLIIIFCVFNMSTVNLNYLCLDLAQKQPIQLKIFHSATTFHHVISTKIFDAKQWCLFQNWSHSLITEKSLLNETKMSVRALICSVKSEGKFIAIYYCLTQKSNWTKMCGNLPVHTNSFLHWKYWEVMDMRAWNSICSLYRHCQFVSWMTSQRGVATFCFPPILLVNCY